MLKEHVRGQVRFTRFKQGHLYYETELGLEFPVPISEAGEAEFKSVDRAMLFMRYIRKHLNTLEAKDNSISSESESVPGNSQ